MNIKQHKQKLNKKYNQAIVDKVLNSMWSKLGNELDECDDVRMVTLKLTMKCLTIKIVTQVLY